MTIQDRYKKKNKKLVWVSVKKNTDPPSIRDIILALTACWSQGQGFLGCFFQSRESRQHVFEISLFGCDLFILFIYLQDVRFYHGPPSKFDD